MKNSALYSKIPVAIYRNILPMVVLNRFALKLVKSASKEKNKTVAPIIIKKVVIRISILLKFLSDLSFKDFFFIYILSFYHLSGDTSCHSNQYIPMLMPLHKQLNIRSLKNQPIETCVIK